MGGRLRKSRVLSDAAVIEKLNAQFVPVALNLTHDKFPDAPALAPWRWIFEHVWTSKFGFATSLVCDPTATFPLAHSGSGFKSEFWTSKNYHAHLFLPFLDKALGLRQVHDAILKADLPAEEKEHLLLAMLAREFDISIARVKKFMESEMPDVKLGVR